jgi:hypothetical protein
LQAFGSTIHQHECVNYLNKQANWGLRKQYVFLLAESSEMRKQSGILRKRYVFLLAESSKMSKQLSILRKQYA